MADDLVGQARSLAMQIDPMLLGGPDARLLLALAARIKALEAALAEARRTALTECLRIAKAAQYSKSPATDTMRGIQKLIEDSPAPPPVV